MADTDEPQPGPGERSVPLRPATGIAERVRTAPFSRPAPVVLGERVDTGEGA
ncbi:hypothetical protein ABZ848_46810 [Streptomyces sp. NPDC047081]|uniref:hypothetical protein n=1 Tax=Streptomyces sp. NPDC047081 TaxID=3154706 RepID=UPI0033E30277